jgi:hypothetical protein
MIWHKGKGRAVAGLQQQRIILTDACDVTVGSLQQIRNLTSSRQNMDF